MQPDLTSGVPQTQPTPTTPDPNPRE
jgi:hypothetical protein